MIQHEDLFMKICDNFHDEINQVLIDIEPTTGAHFWFERKSIEGKFFILKDLLLSLNATDIARYQLINLKNILNKYKPILENWFSSHDIATGFVYFYPEDLRKTENYFHQFEDCQINWYHEISTGYLYMIGIEIVGFPNDCTFKLIARLKNDKIIIKECLDPLFLIEYERGKLIGNPRRDRQEQEKIEYEIHQKDPLRWKKGKENAKNKFENFAQETKDKIDLLLSDFDRCIELCNSLIESIVNDTEQKNLPELEKIFTILKGTYINETLDRFLSIFNSNYSGEKLIWLKSGPQLKYFVDQLNRKLKLSDEINKWADVRFKMSTRVNRLPGYLGKQTSKGEYQLLTQGNLKKEPLFKLFRE